MKLALGLSFIVLSGIVVLADLAWKLFWAGTDRDQVKEQMVSIFAICLSLFFNFCGIGFLVAKALAKESSFSKYSSVEGVIFGGIFLAISAILAVGTVIWALDLNKIPEGTENKKEKEERRTKCIVLWNVTQWGLSYLSWTLIFLGVATSLHP